MGKEFSSEGYLPASASRHLPSPAHDAARQYIERYAGFFPEKCLDGLRIGVFQHSTVGRDIFVEIINRLGAATIPLGRSDHFIAVDTEAVSGREQLADWVRSNRLHALVSADGDADRPLFVSETGEIVRGDVLGILVADYLRARGVVVPVSCNTAVDLWNRFELVRRTRIGSPWVIEGMDHLIEQGLSPVVGYEANGGFLTGTDIVGRAGTCLASLPTRDAVLPILSLLHSSVIENCPVSQLQQLLPPRFTESGLLREYPSDLGRATIDQFRNHGLSLAREFFADSFGAPTALDLTDGARITFQTGEIIHLRPSGNAPEFRCYTEADTETRTRAMNVLATSMIADVVKPWVSAHSGGDRSGLARTSIPGHPADS
jgi:phosphomannomutase